MTRVRPHPHRGPVIAAGAVPLALAAIVIELRMTQWSLGPRFVVVALIAALLLTMGLLAELEGDAPRAYHSVLLASGLLPMIVALQLLAEVLGAHRPPGAGADTWTFAAEAGLAGIGARRAHSAVCTLIAGLATIVAVEAFVSWIFKPTGLGTFRAMLVVLTLMLAFGAVRLRDRQRPHAVQLVNVAGLATLVLAITLAATTFATVAVSRFSSVSSAGFQLAPNPAFGWELYILAVGFGLLAYAAVDHAPGPAYIGVVLLAVFALLVGLFGSGQRSLVGWPLFLLVIGFAGLVVGLRPRQPLPPPPAPGVAAPTVPLHSASEDEA
jgi:hypothetical protein